MVVILAMGDLNTINETSHNLKTMRRDHAQSKMFERW